MNIACITNSSYPFMMYLRLMKCSFDYKNINVHILTDMDLNNFNLKYYLDSYCIKNIKPLYHNDNKILNAKEFVNQIKKYGLIFIDTEPPRNLSSHFEEMFRTKINIAVYQHGFGKWVAQKPNNEIDSKYIIAWGKKWKEYYSQFHPNCFYFGRLDYDFIYNNKNRNKKKIFDVFLGITNATLEGLFSINFYDKALKRLRKFFNRNYSIICTVPPASPNLYHIYEEYLKRFDINFKIYRNINPLQVLEFISQSRFYLGTISTLVLDSLYFGNKVLVLDWDKHFSKDLNISIANFYEYRQYLQNYINFLHIECDNFNDVLENNCKNVDELIKDNFGNIDGKTGKRMFNG